MSERPVHLADTRFGYAILLVFVVLHPIVLASLELHDTVMRWLGALPVGDAGLVTDVYTAVYAPLCGWAAFHLWRSGRHRVSAIGCGVLFVLAVALLLRPRLTT